MIIPTYNEQENIPKILPEVFAQSDDLHVLIIDDNSPDGTANTVKGLMMNYPGRLHLLERPGKQGLGRAYIAGFHWALDHHYDFIFEMDADLSHPPSALPALYEKCFTGGADLSIGSRYTKGGKVSNWPLNRILQSYFASVYVRIITWIPVKDTTAGFVCFKRKVLETIDFDKIKFIGYAFQIEMKFAAWKSGFKLKEVPITFTDRTIGESKMSKGIFKEAVFGVLKMKWFSFDHSYKKLS